MSLTTIIRATGAALPAQCVTNQDLVARGVDTDHDWIVQRTGIHQRYIAGAGETTATLAAAAALDAMVRAGLGAGDIDAVIVATTTPDYTFPAVAAQVQAAIGMTRGFAFDLQAVCSGFVYGLSVADAMIKAGQARRILLIGAETMSRVLDWDDRRTCVLFGDGAGAVILEASEDTTRGIIATKLYSDGRHMDLLKTTGGVSRTGAAGVITMEGQEVFKHAVQSMKQAVTDILAATHTDPSQIDWLVPHQANLRIIQSLAAHLDLPMDRVIVTVGQHANTSAASIPLALHEGISAGRITEGQKLLLESMGGGFTWGGALIDV